MGFADILERTGGMGRFQITQVFLLCLPILLMASHNLLQNFSAAIPSHWCKINGTGILNSSDEGLVGMFNPLDEKGMPESCLEFVEIQWRPVGSNMTSHNSTGAETRSCTIGWEYDREEFTSTIISEWDLVCANRNRRQLAQSLYMAGVLVGAVILGGLSDKYGRRALLIWSYLQMAISGICTAFSPNYLSYCVFRFLGGMALSGIGLNTTALIVEWVPTKVRTITGTLAGYSYTVGQLILAGLAYGIRDWRWLQLCVSLPFFIFFLYSWWFPESARWLVLSGNPSKAVKEMKRVAKYNGRQEEAEKITLESLKADMMKEMACSNSSYTILDLVRTSNVRRISFAVSFVWFSTSFAYYGLAMDLQKFGVSIYLIQVIFGAVDFPAKLISTTSMIYIGRRVTQFFSLSLGGLAILANIFVPNELQIVRTSLAVFGKGCLAASFSCVFLYTTELYPTVIRQSGLGLGSTMARLGGIVAPLVKLLGEFYPFLPLLIYGGAPILSGLLIYFLPETVNKPLPDTIEEVETGKKKTPVKEIVPLQTVTTSPVRVAL
ncbi:solute carrier family 22 member 6-A-like [Hyla sarda]|uniref:solute carrier family 22 member 6-A-like n=1 Tax=Hyla sarda TaxID=327740 RepID=UPI0024C3FA29|nr:solute carrier family 22 member 6-A-like [Hyla sarda]XP_056382940.1 solute carrier family 22 member 6-A-like [Hyla sarda]